MRSALRKLREDLRAKARWCYQDDSPKGVLKTLATDGTSAMILYRLMQGSREMGLVPLEMAFNKLNSAVNSCVIGRGTDSAPASSSCTRTAWSSTARSGAATTW